MKAVLSRRAGEDMNKTTMYSLEVNSAIKSKATSGIVVRTSIGSGSVSAMVMASLVNRNILPATSVIAV